MPAPRDLEPVAMTEAERLAERRFEAGFVFETTPVGYVYDGTGPLFDAGETICSVHADFRLGYHPDHWTECADDGSCFICAEDRQIGPH